MRGRERLRQGGPTGLSLQTTELRTNGRLWLGEQPALTSHTRAPAKPVVGRGEGLQCGGYMNEK
jgi:hypothetical protein